MFTDVTGWQELFGIQIPHDNWQVIAAQHYDTCDTACFFFWGCPASFEYLRYAHMTSYWRNPWAKKIWDRCVSRFMSQTIHHPPLSPFTHELRTGWDCGFQIFPLTTFAKLILASTHKWYNWSGMLRESNSKGHIGRPGKHPWKGPGQPTWKLLGSWNQLNPCAVHRPQEMMDDVVILIYLDGHWNCGPVDPVTDWRFQIFFRLGI